MVRLKKTILTEADYNEFYKAVLYGKIEDPLFTAVPVAYRDMCRTIRGFAKNPDHDQIFRSCEQVIYDEIERMIKWNGKSSQDMFDKWHESTCKRLILFSTDILTYGQAQKWINMTLKYLSMFDHKQTEKVYEFFHVPIDNYIIKATNYKFTSAWSKINSYEEYIDFQRWFRNHYDGIPLDVEFNMWLTEGKGINDNKEVVA